LDGATIATLASAVLTIVSVVLGAKYEQGKKKAKQLTGLLDSVIAAVEDDKISEEERQTIIDGAKRLVSDE
jgi:hypothetical protein